ncbi:MAG: multidrug transporter substrate-binding protein [Myxococcaceae bacterium]|nr:multidrug transporter substrate-binding protein [Myxococcaceae bacterium]
MSPLLMMVGSTVLMAFREIRRNTLRSVLTMLGIVIGVAAVIALVTLGRGASDKVTSEVSSMGVNMLTIMPGAQRRGPSNVTAAPLTLEDVKALQRDVQVLSAVAPTSSRGVLSVYANKSWNTSVMGTTNEYFSVRNTHIESGRIFADVELSGGQPVCVIGATVRRELFGADNPLGAQVRLGRVSCLVIGLTRAKGQSTFGMDQDDYVLMPLSAFQRRIAGNNDVGAIAVSVIDESQTNRAKQQIAGLLRERRRVAEGQVDDFTVHDTREIVQTLQTVTGVLTALLGAVAAVSLIVGGIGIMNIMLVSVTERTREIGIRLAIGARTYEVMLQFLVESIVLCVLGGILGMLLGLGGSYAVGRAIDIPFTFLPEVVLIAVLFSGFVGVAFGFFPARKAARLNPIEALRHE